MFCMGVAGPGVNERERKIYPAGIISSIILEVLGKVFLLYLEF